MDAMSSGVAASRRTARSPMTWTRSGKCAICAATSIARGRRSSSSMYCGKVSHSQLRPAASTGLGISSTPSMEGVEEIPNPVLAAGLNWEWETFPQYMDELDRRPRAIDVAAQIAHLPLRVHVMGDCAVRREAPTPDDIASMRDLTVEALRSGAFGFTTSSTDSHKTPEGDLVPSRDADDH